MPDELSTLREHFGRFRDVTLQHLELLPEDKLVWIPGTPLRTLGENFVHIAQVEQFYMRGVIDNSWDRAILKSFGECRGKAKIRQVLLDSRAFAQEKLALISADRLTEVPKVPDVPVPWTLRDWLWYVLEHEVHHKAQLALYLRMLGITPPFFAYVFPNNFRPDM